MALPPAVVADADVLFGATTRGLLIQLDYAGLLHLHWSPLILDELSRALVKSKQKAALAAAKAHEALMDRSLPKAMVDVAMVQAQYAAVSNAVRSTKDAHVAVLDGDAELTVGGRAHEVVGPGGIIGLPSMFTRLDSTADAEARKPVRALVASHKQFNSLVANPEIEIRFKAAMFDRLRDEVYQLTHKAAKAPTARKAKK